MNLSFLEKCNKVYEELLKHLLEIRGNEDAEACLNWIQIMADFSWRNHTGRYADGNIENIAFEIGEDLEQLVGEWHRQESIADYQKVPNDGRRNLLHVATTFYVGGHPRIIANWIKKDPDTCHSLLVTNLEGNQIPSWLSEAVIKNGGALIVLPPKANLLSKAWCLREIVQSSVDLVVLHHNPNDVLPVVAFATKECPPVAILNHADHVFWLGSSIAETVINIRTSGKELSEERRYAKHGSILPIPLEIDSARMTRREARQQLNIPDEQVMLLSIGAAYKYTPSKSHNFYRAVTKILNRNPEAHLYLIGVEWTERIEHLCEAKHERFHFMGVVEDPSLYRAAADIYLEGFPFGSLTALLETASLRICPVLALAPASPVLVSDDLALKGVVDNAKSEEQYIENVGFLIRQPSERHQIADQAKEKIIAHHSGEKWREYLQDVYRWLEGAHHEPYRIPSSVCLETQDDLSLSSFHFFLCGNRPRLFEVAARTFPNISIKEIVRLLSISLKMKDTKVSYAHLYSNWWRELLKPRIIRSVRQNFVVSALLRNR